MAELRLMRPDDVPGVMDVATVAFEDLERRLGDPPSPRPTRVQAQQRFGHPLATDADGSWVAEEDGRLVGAAMAILREGIWGLSLLVVAPAAQSAGLGRALLERTLAYGAGARGGIILASSDSRALRAYARAGFAWQPTGLARGVPRRRDVPRVVRDGTLADIPFTDAVDRTLRGAPHGADIGAMLAAGCRMFVIEERGYALARDGRVYLLAALDEAAAGDLLRATIATTPDRGIAEVPWLGAAQSWALGVVVEAGLELSVRGAQFVRGALGPMTPYIPNGAYL